jgi:membrane protein YqaA with SNARE-associated domain
LKNSIAKLLLKYKVFVLGVLGPLGFWGAGVIAFVDSGTLPVPMDLIMAGYVWNDKHHFYLYVLLAAIGSALGGMIPFLLGRAGGELFLLRRIDRARYEQLLHRFEKQEFLAMMVPSMLPPPTPWKLFVFAAGVFEMRIVDFMLAVFVGRLLRFGIEAVLVIRYGPQIVSIASDLAKQHTRGLMIGLAVAGGLLVFWIVHRVRRKKKPIAA